MAYNDRPSADRAEYLAAVAGGYDDRLALIFQQASARAAAAAEKARLNGLAPPWMLQNPANETPDVVPSPLVQGPGIEPGTTLDDLDPLDNPVNLSIPARGNPNMDGSMPDMVFDDYDAAAKAAIAGNKTTSYVTTAGDTVRVTPREAMNNALEDQFVRGRLVDPGNDGSLASIAPGSQTEYRTNPVTGEREIVGKPGQYPDRFVRDENGKIQVSPTTGKPLPPGEVFMGFLAGPSVDGPANMMVDGELVNTRTLDSGTDPYFLSTDAAKNFATLPPDLTDQIINISYAYYGRPVDPSWVAGWWGRAVDDAAGAYQLTGKLISPLEIYDDLVAQAAAADAAALASAGRGGGGGGYGGGGGGATVQLTNYTSAKAILNAAMSSFLGRQASDSEIEQFLAQLNAQEMRNPSKVEDIGGVMVQTGGFEPTQFAEDYAKSLEGSGEYQAATTYLDAFLSALGGKVGVI